MPTLSEFQKMFQALQLESPVGPNDPVYLDYFSKLEHYHMDSDPIAELATSIKFTPNSAGALHLLSGQRSSGKSSELLRQIGRAHV